MSILKPGDFTTLVDGLDHPEGVTWGPDGHIYAGGEAGQIYRISTSGEVTQIASTGGFVLGLCLDGKSNIYACDLKLQSVFRIDQEGGVSVYSQGLPDQAIKLPNYPVFDGEGNLYVSDSGGWHENNGCLLCITPDGQTKLLSTDVSAFPNGMALSPDSNSLYVVVSNLPGVVRLSLETGGRVSTPEVVVELPHTVPDGLAFDQQGNLLISCYTPDVIYRLSANRKLDVLVEDEESTTISAPTNMVFAGPDLSMLVVSTLGRWHLAQTHVEIPGSPLHYPQLP
jgi:gluconolactonase